MPSSLWISFVIKDLISLCLCACVHACLCLGVCMRQDRSGCHIPCQKLEVEQAVCEAPDTGAGDATAWRVSMHQHSQEAVVWTEG